MATKEVKLILTEKGEFSIQGNVNSFEMLGVIEHAKNVITRDLMNPRPKEVPAPLTTAEIMESMGQVNKADYPTKESQELEDKFPKHE